MVLSCTDTACITKYRWLGSSKTLMEFDELVAEPYVGSNFWALATSPGFSRTKEHIGMNLNAVPRWDENYKERTERQKAR